jgi:hypothetical protein
MFKTATELAAGGRPHLGCGAALLSLAGMDAQALNQWASTFDANVRVEKSVAHSTMVCVWRAVVRGGVSARRGRGGQRGVLRRLCMSAWLQRTVEETGREL